MKGFETLVGKAEMKRMIDEMDDEDLAYLFVLRWNGPKTASEGECVVKNYLLSPNTSVLERIGFAEVIRQRLVGVLEDT
jgi:hypothetical protein